MVAATIWFALTAFVAGEGIRSLPVARSVAWQRWGARIFLAGALACAAHFVATMALHHGWSQAQAWEFTARETARIYGVSWGGGLVVNYVFLGVWLADAVYWLRHARDSSAGVPPARWALRAFYLLIIFNAAVVFTTGIGRAAGIVLTVVLLAFWLRRQAGERRISPGITS